MTLDEATFHQRADETIERMISALDDAIGDTADVELQGGIATIALSNGKSYIVNKNAPNCEIWLASPTSGGWHFAWDQSKNAWISTRAPYSALTDLLAREIEAATGISVAL
jgi:frataxin